MRPLRGFADHDREILMDKHAFVALLHYALASPAVSRPNKAALPRPKFGFEGRVLSCVSRRTELLMPVRRA